MEEVVDFIIKVTKAFDKLVMYLSLAHGWLIRLGLTPNQGLIGLMIIGLISAMFVLKFMLQTSKFLIVILLVILVLMIVGVL